MIKTRRVTTLMPQYKTVVDMYNEAFPDSETAITVFKIFILAQRRFFYCLL